MMLHEDKYAFLALINQIHEVSGLRLDILEKDYYVSLLLRELAEKQKDLPAYFKGGTALYKALKSIRRFSEDIDLTVSIENCSNSQAKRRLEQAAKNYSSLPRTADKAMEEDRRGSITTVYDYEPAVPVDEIDPLQRFRHVKIEATSFTISEPFTAMEVEPILYTFASQEQRQILQDRYGLMPFDLLTIRLERIFADKILAAEFYYDREMYFDVAKHVYDVSIDIIMLHTFRRRVTASAAFAKSKCIVIDADGFDIISAGQLFCNDPDDRIRCACPDRTAVYDKCSHLPPLFTKQRVAGTFISQQLVSYHKPAYTTINRAFNHPNRSAQPRKNVFGSASSFVSHLMLYLFYGQILPREDIAHIKFSISHKPL